MKMTEKYYCRYCGEEVIPPISIFGVAFESAVVDPRISFQLGCDVCKHERKDMRFEAIVCKRSEWS